MLTDLDPRLHARRTGDRLTSLGASVALAGLVATGCDYGITVRGVVADEQEAPVASASLIVDDLSNDLLRQFLAGDRPSPPWRHQTDDSGRFETSPTLGGSEHHEVWIVVGKSGYRDFQQLVWSGDGGTDHVFDLAITLVACTSDDPNPGCSRPP
jgi:hypothetical protein